MRRILILSVFFTLSLLTPVVAQRLDSGAYIYPIRDVAGLYSANFGEIRPGHFHSGVDIKTDGVEGKSVVAVADGYISRITVTPSGFGRALYITLRNGTTAVYGHLQRFRDDLEAEIRTERYRRRSNTADLHFDAWRFPVKQGDVVAFSGNSGSSYGAHLHFELRDTRTQRYLNLVRERVIRPKDTLAPRILRIHYIEVDTVGGICRHAAPTTYPVVRGNDGAYRLTHTDPLPIGTRGYFVAEVTDRRNGVQNTFGVWRVAASLDGAPYFEYRMDGFLPGQSRYCDAVSCYSLQLGSRNEAIRLAQLAEAPDMFYTVVHNRGIVGAAEGQIRRLRIEAEDDCGNRSSLEFTVQGTGIAYHAPPDTATIALFPNRAAHLTQGRNFSLQIPAGVLYEPIYGRITQEPAHASPEGVVVLSPVYRIFTEATPLYKAVEVTLRAEIPRTLQLRAALASVSSRGALSYLGGSYSDGGVTAQTRTASGWVLVADTLPPRITPLFKQGTNLRNTNSLRLRISDNFSGIASCSLSIDGAWVPSDRLPIQGILFHRFDTPPSGKNHTAELVVTDASGNSIRWKGTFYR